MGADFTYALCPREVDKDTALRRILEMTDNQIRQVMIDLGDDYDFDDTDLKDVQLYRDTLVMDLECVYGGYRDTATLVLDGKFYVLTGGMSWGEEPTDSYRSIWRIDAAQVTAPEGEWCKAVLAANNKEGE